MPDGCLAQAVNVERGRATKPAAYDHTLAMTDVVVAWRAVDVVAFLAPLQERSCHWKWHHVGELAGDFPRVHLLIEP